MDRHKHEMGDITVLTARTDGLYTYYTVMSWPLLQQMSIVSVWRTTFIPTLNHSEHNSTGQRVLLNRVMFRGFGDDAILGWGGGGYHFERRHVEYRPWIHVNYSRLKGICPKHLYFVAFLQTSQRYIWDKKIVWWLRTIFSVLLRSECIGYTKCN